MAPSHLSPTESHASLGVPTGGLLYSSPSGSGGPEAGVQQGGETRAQLHDGHPLRQRGEARQGTQTRAVAQWLDPRPACIGP